MCTAHTEMPVNSCMHVAARQLLDANVQESQIELQIRASMLLIQMF